MPAAVTPTIRRFPNPSAAMSSSIVKCIDASVRGRQRLRRVDRHGFSVALKHSLTGLHHEQLSRAVRADVAFTELIRHRAFPSCECWKANTAYRARIVLTMIGG